MRSLTAAVQGIGLLGPGLENWPAATAVLTGAGRYSPQPAVLPPPAALPPAERRRTGSVVRLALAVGFEAVARADVKAAELPTVFSSSGGDGNNCHEICQTLATADRQISPTRFHNSVHNAASGYWSIAAGATPASSVLCAFDASFAAGLLDALTQVAVDRKSVLLIAYDAAYPEPLRATRPIPDAFGVGMVLAPVSGGGDPGASVPAGDSLADPPLGIASLPARSRSVVITASLTEALPDRMPDPRLESLRGTIPAARCLPLLAKLARRESGRVVLEYLDPLRLAVEVST
jgi:Beta-ketoacyl synthase, N-terminal domain